MKAKDRVRVMRYECYNCDNLFGPIFVPGCRANYYPGDIEDKEMCKGYKAISAIGDKEIRERKKKGE